jgi:hypothetical protein
MSELLAALVRGLIVLLGHLAAALDLKELWEGRQRRRRRAALARGERIEVPCVLRDPELTGGGRTLGHLSVGGPSVDWLAGGGRAPVPFAPGPLAMHAVDERAVTFRAADGRTELRLHPDEAPLVLRALGSP